MKIANTIISLLAGLSLLTACSLEEYPYGFYSEDNFYKTSEDAKAAVNYIYDAINYLDYSRAIVFLGDMNTDCLSPKGDANASNKALDSWNQTNFTTNTTLSNVFKYSYITINRANTVIEKVGAMTNIDEDLKNRYVGEGYFMRGYSYFCLARNFGKVPVHLSSVGDLSASAVPAAESLDEIWGIVIDDLKKASDLLPYFKEAETGHADKVAAYGFLAKAYLYLASAKEHGVPQYSEMSFNVDEYYTEAVKYAGYVVDNPAQTTFGFDPDLMDIYDVENPRGPEHIFIMSMDRTGDNEGQYSKISKMYLPYISGGEVYIRQADTDTFIPTHDGWGEYRTTTAFYDSFESGDLRHDWLICNEVYDEAGNLTYSVANGKLSYPFCRKFIDPKHIGDKTSTRPFLLRYSDVALVYAEAAGPTAKSYELLNYIRHRAGLGDVAPGLDLASFREKVLLERSYELSFEGNQCYDLRRWNRLHTDITAVKEQGLSAEDVVFYPLPSLESDLNPNL